MKENEIKVNKIYYIIFIQFKLKQKNLKKDDETSSSDESENKNEPALATTATTTTEDNIEVPTDKIKLINFQPTAKKTVERDPNRQILIDYLF